MAQGRKTGGRKAGTPNKLTAERERRMQEAAAKINEVLGDAFEGDAHALLMAIYKDKTLPMDMRADAAKAAIRFEKPALASTDNRITDTTRYVVALPEGGVSAEEWQAKYAPASKSDVQH